MDEDKREMASALFLSVGIPDKTVTATVNNADLAAFLVSLVEKSKAPEGSDCGPLLLHLAQNANKHRIPAEECFVVAPLIGDGRLKSGRQVDAAVSYMKEGRDLSDVAALEESCGVGVVVTREEIEAAVHEVLAPALDRLKEQRYRLPLGPFIGKLTGLLPWANASEIRDELNRQVVDILGPKTEEDERPLPPKPKGGKPGKKAPPVCKKGVKAAPVAAAGGGGGGAASSDAVDAESEPVKFKEMVGRDLLAAHNSESALAKHREAVGDMVVTRFPPEPNGFLHVGHAKAMNLDFGYARELGGQCLLRFDDTNPTAEKQEYIDSIIENVRWLGHEPARITYSSDYFQELYEIALTLIRRGLAYVCHQTRDEMKKSRELLTPSPYRERSVEENLRLFDDMRMGLCKEGECVLRLKMDYANVNPNMRDLVAYRIKYHEHPRTGDAWCIYPSYDYTHCLVDSLENVTHSLCSLEFETRRESYFWLLDVLDMWKPNVWEFSRLNLSYNVMSKRKLNYLVTKGVVRGWDDPRLLTLEGLRRRGYSPQSLNHMCQLVGVTRNMIRIRMQLLEHCCRTDLDANVHRRYIVTDPLKVVIENLDASVAHECVMPNHPANESFGSRAVPLTPVLYIERSDFRVQDSKNFFGLAPNKEVGLRFSGMNIRCTSFETSSDGEVTVVRCVADLERKNKVKGHLHWIAEPSAGQEPRRVEIRLYDYLFNSPVPEEEPDWLSTLNPESEVVKHGYAEEAVFQMGVGERFQAERIGFFVVDRDSVPGEKLVINRIVSLKEAKDRD